MYFINTFWKPCRFESQNVKTYKQQHRIFDKATIKRTQTFRATMFVALVHRRTTEPPKHYTLNQNERQINAHTPSQFNFVQALFSCISNAFFCDPQIKISFSRNYLVFLSFMLIAKSMEIRFLSQIVTPCVKHILLFDT